MSDDEEYLIRRYGGTNPNDWSSNVYDDGGHLPAGSTPMTLHPDECIVRPEDPYTCIRPDHDDHPARLGQKLSPLPLEGEVIPTPPEPPRDHVLVSRSGYVFMWSDELDNWLEVDSEHGYPMSWEEIFQRHKPLTIYKPVKEIP